MNLKELYNQIGNYDIAMGYFAGNEKMLAKFIKRFPNDKSYGRLVLAYEQNDDTNVYRSAITLCEVCGSLSLTYMGQTARVIADAYQTGEAAVRGLFNVPLLMKTLADQYECAVEAIRKLN